MKKRHRQSNVGSKNKSKNRKNSKQSRRKLKKLDWEWRRKRIRNPRSPDRQDQNYWQDLTGKVIQVFYHLKDKDKSIEYSLCLKMMTWQILWTKVKKSKSHLSLLIVASKRRKIQKVLLLMLVWVLREKLSLKTIQMKISRKSNTITEGATLKKVLSVTLIRVHNATSIKVHSVTLMMRVQVNWLIQINTHNNSCREIKQGRSSKKLTLEAASNKILRLERWINKSRILNTMVFFSISTVRDSAALYRWTSSTHSNQCLFKINPILQVTLPKICMEITWDKAVTTPKWAKKI